jgi:hypothetical protein
MLKPQEDQYAMYLYLGDSKINSYKKAFPKCKNWKDDTIYVKACVLSKTDKITVRLKELEEQTKAKTNTEALLSASDVLNKISDVIDRNEDIDDKTALKALELYGKHLKLFTDKVEHSGEIKMPVIKITK